jgi:hypothetical protein
MNSEGRPEDGPATNNITRRAPYHRLTPLQEVLQEQAAVFQHAIEQLDERGYGVMLEILTMRVAQEHRRRLDREKR